MKIFRQIKFLILILIAFGCGKINQEELEWNKIKNSSDFSSFFNFALKVKDSTLFDICSDTLFQFIENQDVSALHYNQFYDFESKKLIDKLEFEDFKTYSITKNNVLVISIDKNDNKKDYYYDTLLTDYKEKLKYLLETNENSGNLPDTRSVVFNGKNYNSKALGIIIYTQLYSDENNKRTSWRIIFKTLKEIKSSISLVRENLGIKLFKTKYEDLSGDQENLVNGLIPMWITIYFNNILLTPPPPNL